MKRLILFAASVVCITAVCSCKKYLDAKPDQSLQVPSSVADLQALLDDGNYMNSQNGISFDESSADDFFITNDVYNQLDKPNRDTYIWNNKNYSNTNNDWFNLYNIINVANVVLDNISRIPGNEGNLAAWGNAKGSALFFRANALLHGAFIFCKAYDASTAAQDYGMALRLTSDFNLSSSRSTLHETYARIVEDLHDAAGLLPGVPVHVLRPSRSSAYALLARTYLSMRRYDSCLKYADLALQIKSTLVDFNTLSVSASYPFRRYSPEDMFDDVTVQSNYYASSKYYGRIDSTLYNSYEDNDLRKVIYFKTEADGYSFKGSYARSIPFIGIATDEVYLMRAECYARLGNTDAALNDLNTLLVTRWAAGTFVPFTASSAPDALAIILQERRKELLFRSLRWMDIKRLNKDGAGIILTRVIGGTTYTLPPNDNRYALALPADIIRLTGMPQNP
jgi:starch-binding outer membrane protein, SusD/RagB family